MVHLCVIAIGGALWQFGSSRHTFCCCFVYTCCMNETNTKYKLLSNVCRRKFVSTSVVARLNCSNTFSELIKYVHPFELFCILVPLVVPSAHAQTKYVTKCVTIADMTKMSNSSTFYAKWGIRWIEWFRIIDVVYVEEVVNHFFIPFLRFVKPQFKIDWSSSDAPWPSILRSCVKCVQFQGRTLFFAHFLSKNHLLINCRFSFVFY